MKAYTVRFRCRLRLEEDDSINEEDYDVVIEAENLEGVFSKLDEFLDEWDEGASISLNAPGGEIMVETLEILSPEGDVLYWLRIQESICFLEKTGFRTDFARTPVPILTKVAQFPGFRAEFFQHLCADVLKQFAGEEMNPR